MTNFAGNLDGVPKLITDTNIKKLPDVNFLRPGQPEEEFVEILEDTAPGELLLDKSHYGLALGLGGLAVQRKMQSKFIEQPDFGYGREATQNGVYFGQLTVTTPSGIGAPDFVAVKPHSFSCDPETIVREWAANKFLNTVDGHVRAYEPLGIWRGDSGVYQLLTRYDASVKTFDNVFWANDEKAPGITKEQIEESLRLCMFGLGLGNGFGVVHNDARVKNVGVDRRCVRFVDLEDMTVQPQLGNVDNEGLSAAELVDDEIATFAGSLFEEGSTSERVIDLVATSLMKPVIQKACFKSYSAGYERGVKYSMQNLTQTVDQRSIAEHFAAATQMIA